MTTLLQDGIQKVIKGVTRLQAGPRGLHQVGAQAASARTRRRLARRLDGLAGRARLARPATVAVVLLLVGEEEQAGGLARRLHERQSCAVCSFSRPAVTAAYSFSSSLIWRSRSLYDRLRAAAGPRCARPAPCFWASMADAVARTAAWRASRSSPCCARRARPARRSSSAAFRGAQAVAAAVGAGGGDGADRLRRSLSSAVGPRTPNSTSAARARPRGRRPGRGPARRCGAGSGGRTAGGPASAARRARPYASDCSYNRRRWPTSWAAARRRWQPDRRGLHPHQPEHAARLRARRARGPEARSWSSCSGTRAPSSPPPDDALANQAQATARSRASTPAS